MRVSSRAGRLPSRLLRPAWRSGPIRYPYRSRRRCRPGTARDAGPLEEHGCASATRAATSTGAVDLDPHRLAGQRQFIRVKVGGFNNSQVRRNTSPASSKTMSPGTSRSAGIRRVLPPRQHSGRTTSEGSYGLDRSNALISVTKPIAVLMIRTPTMAPLPPIPESRMRRRRQRRAGQPQGSETDAEG